MDEVREKKQEIRNEMVTRLNLLGNEVIAEKTRIIESRLFDFANFLEAKIVMLYMSMENEVATDKIIKRAYDYGKIIVFPLFSSVRSAIKLMKVDNPDKDFIPDSRGRLEPNPARCKPVPLDCIDIAIVPGVAMDEKGGRLGPGDGHYDRVIPDLPMTTRKVGLVFEDQLLPQIPMESHDKHVDIIITDRRVIYKI